MPVGPATIGQFLERLADSGVARPGELRGCSEAELAVFEEQFGLVLPETYRQFLSLMGQSAGKLFSHDHVQVQYLAVLSMNDELHPADEPAEGDGPDWEDESALTGATLPDKALVILGRLGEQYLFIICDRADDSPVYYFSEEGEPPEKVHDSVLDWLDAWREEAVDAIRGGYYNSA